MYLGESRGGKEVAPTGFTYYGGRRRFARGVRQMPVATWGGGINRGAELETRNAWIRANRTKSVPGRARNVMYFAEVENYTDEMFAGLEGAKFRFRGNTYKIADGDIYVMEGVEASTFDELNGLEGWNPFKKVGRVLRKHRAVVKRKVKKFVKSKAGKAIIGVGLAFTGVGLIGMAAYGAAGIGAGITAVGSAVGGGIASGAGALWTGAKAVGGRVIGMLGKKGGGGGGVSVEEPSIQASRGVLDSPGGVGASGGGGWFTESNMKSAASLATTALGAYGTYQAARGQKAAAEAATAAEAGMAPGYGPGGGYGGGAVGDRSGGETFPAGGLNTEFAPDVPVEPEIPDVTQYAGLQTPMLLLLGGGLLLMALSKRR